MESSNRRSWQEDIYWQNFHFANFSLTLPNDFHLRLKLPKKFTDYMRTKLPEQIVLKVSRESWNVNLVKDKDDIVLQGDGWKVFVNAYSLKKEDVLVFNYNRRECFEVFLFDGENLCEKEASYFVMKDRQEENLNGKEKEDRVHRREAKETLSKQHTDTRRNGRGKNNPGRSTAKRSCTRVHLDYHDQTESETSDENNSSEQLVITTPKKAATVGERDLTFSAMPKRKHNVVKMSTPKNSIAVYALRYKSNRRPVTELEIESAWKKAKEAEATVQSKNPFIVVMRPTCVYKRFFMTIPAEWKPRDVLKKSQELILRVVDKTWVCKISYSKGHRGGLEGVGWKDFARENYLEEFDVCLFVQSDPKDGLHVLDVSIFRVVSEVVAPTLV